jgi:hypothetical protein
VLLLSDCAYSLIMHLVECACTITVLAACFEGLNVVVYMHIVAYVV